MKLQHEQLVLLEEKCRKMKQQIKERKRLSKEPHQEKADQPENNQQYTVEDLESLQEQLRLAETEKQGEEVKLKQQI